MELGKRHTSAVDWRMSLLLPMAPSRGGEEQPQKVLSGKKQTKWNQQSPKKEKTKKAMGEQRESEKA